MVFAKEPYFIYCNICNKCTDLCCSITHICTECNDLLRVIKCKDSTIKEIKRKKKYKAPEMPLL